MTVPRYQQISLDHTPYYHCTSRCVRRAFLCGKDRYTGRNFDHRKRWLEERLVALSNVFAVDLLAYAIMSNHYHLVLRVDIGRVKNWSDADVKEHWAAIFSTPDHISQKLLDLWRQRLCSISWFMRCLNEPMARRSNKEDECTGRFWEGRYKCQALLDNVALLRCMAYVDLNPIRSAIATTPETSSYTSIKARIEGKDQHLLSFADGGSPNADTIPIGRRDYLSLVDWSGRQLRSGKRGRIQFHLPTILDRLNIEGEQWITEMRHYGRWYYRAVGSVQVMERYCLHLGQRWLKGKPKADKVSNQLSFGSMIAF